jgi:hypothetical protein
MTYYGQKRRMIMFKCQRCGEDLLLNKCKCKKFLEDPRARRKEDERYAIKPHPA